MRYRLVCYLSIIVSFLSFARIEAQDLSPRFYDIGSPILQDIWVDPAAGNDANSGNSRVQALRTVTAAWNRIPEAQTLSSHGFRIMLVSGEYPASSLPNYWESRWGTAQYPIIIQAADGQGTVNFRSGPNVFDVKYLYLINLNLVPDPAGDAFHCEQCDHILLRGNLISGGNNREAHETVKVNQSQYIYIEQNNIFGAGDNVIDFVAVQYGHVVRNKIHDAEDWCIYTKGGSAYLRIEANEIYNCGTGGYTAGQGTGFEFMTSPWLHYEAYDIKFINNIVHDTEGAGIGVNGGYNILLAFNTIYRVGSRSHGMEFVFGARSCDGTVSSCVARHNLGGWGPIMVGPSDAIPNRNVFVINNILYNPTGFQSPDQHFAIYAPNVTSVIGQVPSPAHSDTNLVIRGNVLWNGPGDLSLGIEGDTQGCASTNPTCNETQLRSQNMINTIEPQFLNAAVGDFHPIPDGTLSMVTSIVHPAFTGGDRESTPLAPQGNLLNSVGRDFFGNTRSDGTGFVGALIADSVSDGILLPSDGSSVTPTLPPIIRRITLSKKILPRRGGTITVTVRARNAEQVLVIAKYGRAAGITACLNSSGGSVIQERIFRGRIRIPRLRAKVSSARYRVTVRSSNVLIVKERSGGSITLR